VFPAEVGDYLASAGLGLTVGTNLRYVPLTDADPDPAVALLETPGEPDAGTFGASLSASAFQLPRMLVIVRGSRNGASTARTLAKSVYDKLHRLGPVTLSGTTYYDVRAEQQPFGPDYDRNERPVYRFTIAATKAPS
jgi:hypothetical protein